MRETTATQTLTTPASRAGIDAAQRELIDQILDKWSLCVIDLLCEGPLRFNEIRRGLPALTQKSLTTTLRRLERNGMVERVVLAQRPIAVEYRLAPLAFTLRELVDGLFAWTAKVLPDVGEAQRRFDSAVD